MRSIIFCSLGLFLIQSARAEPERKVIEGFVRRDPVLPVNLPDYELTTLDVSKEIVFHFGDQTVIGKIPILAYIPVARAGRAGAVDNLVEARSLLIKAAASQQVTTTDLAAVRDLLERALAALRPDPAAAPLAQANK